MQLNTVIFDMDGLLIDSEPLWKQAAADVFRNYGLQLSPEEYRSTMGMRTSEFVAHWFNRYALPAGQAGPAENAILEKVMKLVQEQGKPMPGVAYIFDFFSQRGFRIGLATSSGPELVEIVVDALGIRDRLLATASAAALEYGKPHPGVYLDCARRLEALPEECICFEDSFNGMIAAKAARMKCVVVPSAAEIQLPVWNAADLKLSSLLNFNELLLSSISIK